MAVGPLVGASAAASLAFILVGCSYSNPDQCSVTCGTGDLCPEGSSCGGDGYCHAADDPDDCTAIINRPDGGPGDDDAASGDGAPCDGEPDELADTDPMDRAIPDNVPAGIDRTISFDTGCVTVESIQVRVEIVHPYRGDVEIRLTSPAGDTELLQASSDDSTPDLFRTYDVVDLAAGESADGDWVLNVSDVFETDVGMLQLWSIGINRAAP